MDETLLRVQGNTLMNATGLVTSEVSAGGSKCNFSLSVLERGGDEFSSRFRSDIMLWWDMSSASTAGESHMMSLVDIRDGAYWDIVAMGKYGDGSYDMLLKDTGKDEEENFYISSVGQYDGDMHDG